MKKFHSGIVKISLVSVFIFFLISPVFAGGPCTGINPSTGKPIPAGCDPTIKPDSGNSAPSPDSGNTSPGLNIKTGINNPLSSELDTIPKFIEKILEIVLMIGVPIVTLAIIYAGFLFVTAQGNSEKLKKAKQTFIYTIIGAALLLGSFVISKAIVGTVEEIKNVDNAQQAK